MALIRCKECRNQISQQALTCPFCGAQNRKPQRGFWGWLFLLAFVGFNILMVVALGSYFIDVGSLIESGNEYERAGAALGTTIGIGMLLEIWALGDIILGLFVLMTKPK